MAELHRELAVAAGGGLLIAAAAGARRTDTHGRWPWAAAVLAPPASVAAARLGAPRAVGAGARPLLVSLPLLLWHQTEEWVLPGGFMPWFNHSVWHSDDAEFPLTRPIALRVNVLAGWGVSTVSAAVLRPVPGLAGAVLASHVANAALHVGRARVERAYNPGLLTGIPLGAIGLWGVLELAADSRARRRGALAGAVAGLAVSAALPLALRRRARASASTGAGASAGAGTSAGAGAAQGADDPAAPGG